MASLVGGKPVVLVLLTQLFLSLFLPALSTSPGSGDGYNINGRVKIPGIGAKGINNPGKLSNVKVILNGGQSVTFLRPDGYFSLAFDAIMEVLLLKIHLDSVIPSLLEFCSKSHNVPAGTHLIEVSAVGYFFSPFLDVPLVIPTDVLVGLSESRDACWGKLRAYEVRVDVSARFPGKVQAALTENRRGLNELVLEPLSEEQYFEIREPFSIMNVVKSPMGLMMGFMVVVMFLMPKLVENMDPEEMRRAQEEMRNQGVPSLANFLPGAARS